MEPRLAFLNIGPFEFLLLAAAAVMLFGADLPAVARKVGVMLGRMRSIATDLARRIETPPELERLQGELREGAAELESEVHAVEDPPQQEPQDSKAHPGSSELEEDSSQTGPDTKRAPNESSEGATGATDRPT